MVVDKMKKSKSNDIRKMTQTDFDNISEQQREFYQDLLDSGKLVIDDGIVLAVEDVGVVSGTGACQIDKVRDTDAIRYPTDGIHEKPVKIHFMNNQTAIEGIFKRAWQYDILVCDDGKQYVIPKHAIACIEEMCRGSDFK